MKIDDILEDILEISLRIVFLLLIINIMVAIAPMSNNKAKSGDGKEIFVFNNVIYETNPDGKITPIYDPYYGPYGNNLFRGLQNFSS